MRCVFGSTKPGKTPASAHAGPISPFLFFREQYFQNSQFTFGSTVPGKTLPRVQKSPRLASLAHPILEALFPEKRPRLSRASAPALIEGERWPNITFFYFSGYSTSIFLFFRSTESPGKIRAKK